MHLINVSLQMMDVHVCMLSMVTSVIISRGDPVRHNSIFRNRGVTGGIRANSGLSTTQMNILKLKQPVLMPYGEVRTSSAHIRITISWWQS